MSGFDIAMRPCGMVGTEAYLCTTAFAVYIKSCGMVNFISLLGSCAAPQGLIPTRKAIYEGPAEKERTVSKKYNAISQRNS